jgi:uncharacterized alpha-E superfamily protein
VGVTELMLLSDASPRSLQTCSQSLHQVLRELARGERLDVVREAGAAEAHTRYARIEDILGGGLEPWLQAAMSRLIGLGNGIHRQFMTSTDVVPA